RIKWAEKDAGLAILRLNRLQNHLEILLATPKTGKSRIVYEEKNKYYIDITDNLFFLDDGFIITSEKSGYNHIYYHSIATENNIAITSGTYDVIEVFGIDTTNGLVYYEAAASSPMDREVYAANLDGTGTKSIAAKAGHNSASFSETYDYFILKWSDANTPPVYSLMDINGNLIKIMESNANLVKMQQEAKFPEIAFDTFTTDEGVSLNYWMILPYDFDPLKKYPVLMYVYGGPGSQTVENLWSYQNLWHIYMAKKGYIVVSVDNRGTGNRGEEFKKCTYKELGKLETIDQISTAEHLASVSYIDPSRIGIWGWSYGGYMTTLCMTKGADIFKTGVAVAPVTNWRYYDNIYTERFMRTPQENGENYDINSPVHHVDSLKGKYMVIHGAADDNVHVQNTYDLVNALIKAGKQFDMFIYPNRNHGIYGGNTRFHLYNMMTNYILENL
ncbi:MAG: prolyl oligopeptidase family serine peptidase, partial [Bacteroidales bacterium]|nr:prolyl oligopeptidase family serine peptidase [Bacteroidales bacterium]